MFINLSGVPTHATHQQCHGLTDLAPGQQQELVRLIDSGARAEARDYPRIAEQIAGLALDAGATVAFIWNPALMVGHISSALTAKGIFCSFVPTNPKRFFIEDWRIRREGGKQTGRPPHQVLIGPKITFIHHLSKYYYDLGGSKWLAKAIDAADLATDAVPMVRAPNKRGSYCGTFRTSLTDEQHAKLKALGGPRWTERQICRDAGLAEMPKPVGSDLTTFIFSLTKEERDWYAAVGGQGWLTSQIDVADVATDVVLKFTQKADPKIQRKVYMTGDQSEKLSQLGGANWVRTKLAALYGKSKSE